MDESERSDGIRYMRLDVLKLTIMGLSGKVVQTLKNSLLTGSHHISPAKSISNNF
jgi:hypothetical protein